LLWPAQDLTDTSLPGRLRPGPCAWKTRPAQISPRRRDDAAITTAKIARAHLNEFPDYYTRLAETEVASCWGRKEASCRSRDHAQCPGVEPGASAQPGDVGHLVRVVAEQQGLRALDPGTCGPGGQQGAAVAGEQVGQRLQGGAPLVVPAGRAADHLGVGAERGVVDERAVGDDTQVDLQFLAVGERAQAR